MKLGLAFDLETTGVDVVKDEPVEIAFALVKPEGEYRITSIIVNSQVPVHPKAQAVHGISPEIVKMGINPGTLTELIVSVIMSQGVDTLIGYNAFSFDIPMLNNLMLRCGSEIDLTKLEVEDPAAWWKCDKIFKIARPKTLAEYEKVDAIRLPYGSRFNLTKVCAELGIEFNNAHMASADLDATIKVWRHMRSE